MSKPIASLSLDFDNKWAYLRAAGREDWQDASSYLQLAADRIVDVLGEKNLPLTAFIVGRDLQSDADCDAILSLRRLPICEYANHSLNHLPWMHTMDDDEIHDEVAQTHDAIEQVTGQRCVGFRGPGFSCPDEVLRVLSRLDYVYDASIFPTSMAPIARAVFLMRTKLQGEQRERAKKLYGGFAAMRNPNRPYRREIDNAALWELPVTVMPLTRTPIHFSYFTFLAGFSTATAKSYFRTALRLCTLTGTSPSILLHPPDFLGREDDADMAYFPGMKMPRDKKISLVKWALGQLAQRFDVHCMIDQVAALDPNSIKRSQLTTVTSPMHAALTT
ncbi:polysaccharide deacetylase family protein [Stieleria varia]|uniref:Polysaccharide deacetylase n=1 Tax=Stieleria varia TaxID=2528005 RepID=A0A5C6A5S5_9BACT|nr:polysaccharide deacetylase family protein [Stieleria varia]TWT94658.1 Polysaccharide deacetylase [Stieleria varia]